MYSTRPQVTVGNAYGHAEPDAAYGRRCFQAGGDTSGDVDDAHMRLSVDQAPTTGGMHPNVVVTALNWHRPLDHMNDFNDP